jgi:hypothetical protein
MTIVSLTRYIIINYKVEEMWEDLGLDGKMKTSPMGSGTDEQAHTLMVTMTITDAFPVT